MEIFLISIFVAACIWAYSVSRGLKFIRAFVFLLELESGKTVQEANWFARAVDFAGSSQYHDSALGYARLVYGGRQLPLIARARQLGFEG